MRNFALRRRKALAFAVLLFLFFHSFTVSHAQTPAFPGATGFGRFAKGARGVASPSVYVVTNLNDSGFGSFRDAVSTPGRFVVFAVGGIINLATDVVVAPNVTIAGQTAPGDGIVLFNKRVTFTGANNTICRYLRIRLGATGNSGKDASGLANGANIIFDHMSFSWGMDEVFSINWDSKGTAPDSITIQNSIIAQGLHRDNHSAGGLIQTPDGGKVSVDLALVEDNHSTFLEIRVIDTGIGIPADKIDRIFERFFQNELPASMVNQGNGIGLSITQEFVRIHGGTIEATSEVGKGSTFRVLLPVTKLEHVESSVDLENGLEELQESLKGSPAGKPSLLLIEDNEDFRHYLKDNLIKEYHVI